MQFGTALAELKAGNAVGRELWNDYQEVVYLKEIKFNGFAPTLVQYHKYSSGNVLKYPGALVDYDDMCADDWEIVEV